MSEIPEGHAETPCAGCIWATWTEESDVGVCDHPVAVATRDNSPMVIDPKPQDHHVHRHLTAETAEGMTCKTRTTF